MGGSFVDNGRSAGFLAVDVEGVVPLFFNFATGPRELNRLLSLKFLSRLKI
jgi:hypothetical protein